MRRLLLSFAILTAIVCATRSIARAERFAQIAGNHPVEAEQRVALGNMDATAPLTMEIHLKLRNEAALDRFLADVQNPNS
ncbi:MAG TPA: hypothetical protein VKR29_10705, partial [Candidatus Binataceae bacterium]|nr:hypothetical protein [Candidatus Binataceae bacterium]